MTEIDECRLAVMSAYIWLSRMKSGDQLEMHRIRDMQLRMEELRNDFEELFP